MTERLCAHEAFNRQVERTPDATAVIDGGRSVTYAQLRRVSLSLGCELRQRGVGPDVAVGLLVERSLEAVVGVLGILEGGGAYVPVSPRDPDARIDGILADAAVSSVVVHASLRQRLASRAAGAVELDFQMLDQGKDRDTLEPLTEPEHLAAIVYTSGTTGQPRGVEIPHRAIMARIENGYRCARGDLQKAPLSVVAHFSDLLLPLLTGEPVIIVDDEDVRSGTGLLQYVVRHGTRRMVFVPSQLAALLGDGTDGAAALRQLDTVIVSGEALSPALAATFRRRLRAATLVNAYGASEVSGLACWGPVDSDDITVGTSMTGCEVLVLDDHLREVPLETMGEVYLGGSQLARGYRNDPALTEERFIPHPLRSGERLFRTGDLAERLADGRLRIVGRRDFEVKVHGFRVNLAELEAELERCVGVERAVVVFDADGSDQRLTAYIVPALECEAGEAPHRLRSLLAERLPAHMVPSRIRVLAALPLLPNGKIDRRAPELEKMAAIVRERISGREPLVGTERRLAELWSEVLRVPHVSPTDDFLSLGGDSIQAMRFVMQATASGLPVRLSQLADAPTLAELARMIDEEITRT